MWITPIGIRLELWRIDDAAVPAGLAGALSTDMVNNVRQTFVLTQRREVHLMRVAVGAC